MAHKQLKHEEEARQWYEKVGDYDPNREAYVRIQQEAAQLLGIGNQEPKK